MKTRLVMVAARKLTKSPALGFPTNTFSTFQSSVKRYTSAAMPKPNAQMMKKRSQ